MPHVDGAFYYPTVSTISLGSHTLLDFYQPVSESSEQPTSLEDRLLFSLCLEPRSLVILKDDMYKTYLHGIRECTRDEIDPKSIANFDRLGNSLNNVETSFTLDRTTRVSITIRHVPKVIKLNINSLLNKKS